MAVKPLPRAVERMRNRREKDKAWLALRKLVLRRDHYGCQACKSRGTDYNPVDVHHLKFRSAGGGDVLENLLALCRRCHALVHAYRLVINGSDANEPLEFEWVRDSQGSRE